MSQPRVRVTIISFILPSDTADKKDTAAGVFSSLSEILDAKNKKTPRSRNVRERNRSRHLMHCRLGQNTDELAATLSDEVGCFHAFRMSLGCQLDNFLEFFLSVKLVQ